MEAILQSTFCSKVCLCLLCVAQNVLLTIDDVHGELFHPSTYSSVVHDIIYIINSLPPNMSTSLIMMISTGNDPPQYGDN